MLILSKNEIEEEKESAFLFSSGQLGTFPYSFFFCVKHG